MLGYIVLLFSLPDHAESVGMTAKQGSIVGYVELMGRINMAATTTFIAGLFSLVIWIFAKSYSVLIFLAFIGGTVVGTFWAARQVFLSFLSSQTIGH
jgi:hypothetical protein